MMNDLSRVFPSPPRVEWFALVAVLTGFLTGCKAPTVNLSTAEPIKVDINVRLDVYQYGDKEKTDASPAPNSPALAAPETNPATRRRNRMADIQTFKNNGLIGENREGLVAIRSDPPGEYGAYVRRTVEAENADRMAQMKELAESRKTSLLEIQKEQAELWRNRAFKGELIEMEIEPGEWRWIEKEG
jgi:uncharacterized protein YdbL (DUF1318 family)